MTLPPHEWDDADHRAAIHMAFDMWFTAYMAGEALTAYSWQGVLRQLTDDARARALRLSNHGERRNYEAGCRCIECKAAVAAYSRERYHRQKANTLATT